MVIPILLKSFSPSNDMFQRFFAPTSKSISTDKLRSLALDLMPQLESQAHRLKSINLSWDYKNGTVVPVFKVELYEQTSPAPIPPTWTSSTE